MLTFDVTRAKSMRLGWGTGVQGLRELSLRRSESLLILERGAKIPGKGQASMNCIYINVCKFKTYMFKKKSKPPAVHSMYTFYQ